MGPLLNSGIGGRLPNHPERAADSVSQSYNVALVDTAGRHATVFVASERPAVVSHLEATTNHRLDQVEHPGGAARFNSVGRLARMQ